MLLSKLESNLLLKFKLTNFLQIEWLGYSLKPVYSDLQFLSTPLVFFYWKNLLSTFHTILMKLETITKRNKKKQIENPLCKSGISQVCTKYWSRLTFLINISLHSSKAWGRLTLIETNLDHSDFSFFSGPLFSSRKRPIVLGTFTCSSKKNYRSVILAAKDTLESFDWSKSFSKAQE